MTPATTLVEATIMEIVSKSTILNALKSHRSLFQFSYNFSATSFWLVGAKFYPRLKGTFFVRA
jgi:hypothetical protein